MGVSRKMLGSQELVQFLGSRVTMRIRWILGALIALSPGVCVFADYNLTTLVSFDASGNNPDCNLIADPAGNLYGTTEAGGPNGGGTVFEIAAGTHALSTLVTFTGSNGSNPTSGLVRDASGNLYGTTIEGGSGVVGTVFEVNPVTHFFATLATFNSSTTGANPYAGLYADSKGNLFGTTEHGGANGDGTIYEVAAGTHALTVLTNFNGTNGNFSESGLIADASGNFYGTCEGGGTNNAGTVFELAAGAHAATVLANFNNSNGAFPSSELLFDGAGNLLGTTTSGGPGIDGTVFKLDPATDLLTTIATFGGARGIAPDAALIEDSAGNFYGTANRGDAFGEGTVFKLDAGTYAFTTLFQFTGANGHFLNGALLDGQGNLFGTTSAGGVNNLGTAFELSPVPEPTGLACASIIGSFILVCRRNTRRSETSTRAWRRSGCLGTCASRRRM
jgi:uncharacterized repeat protein (TIGR03803 family)